MFNKLDQKINNLRYIKGIDAFEIGKSTLGQSITCAHVGNYHGKQIMIDGGIHAREHISSYLVVELAKYLAKQKIDGGVYFVPLCNPDGARIAMDGIDWIDDKKLKQFLLYINNNSNDFSLWKANGLGVDLNVNFDADWGGGVQNVFEYAPANFVGFYPNSEKETKILIDFVAKYQPSACLSFHSKGEVIFYGFEATSESEQIRDLSLAQKISKLNGYEIIKSTGSTGGFTDWVSLHHGICALTIEIGSDKLEHPITTAELPTIFDKNKNISATCLDFVNNSTKIKE